MTKLRHPIVLLHGLLGFTTLRLYGWPVATYFPGIREALEAQGNRVAVPAVSPTRSVADRAAELKAFLDRAPLGGTKVHLIAHSMGGLDARYLISHLDMGGRVLSLTTLGTPHRGTAFADWGVGTLAPMVRPFLDHFGIPSAAFDDLTRPACTAFNSATLDDDRVRYFSVAGRLEADLLTPEWWLSHGIIRAQEGDNDGLVSVESARWGTFLGVWQADHAGLINWPNPVAQARGRWRDRAQDCVDLLAHLAPADADG